MTKNKKKEFTSVEEIQEEKERLNQLKEDMILESRKNNIKNILCKNCDQKLDLNPEEYINELYYSFEAVCPSCDRINRLNISHTDENTTIDIIMGDYTWQTYVPASFTPEMVNAWFEDQLNKIKNNESFLSNEMQILLLKIAQK